MPRRTLGQSTRTVLRIVAIVAALGLFAIPLVAVLLSDTASADTVWTALRIAALEALTVIFVSIMIGSFHPFFNRLARPRLVNRLHIATGIAGFSLAIAHGSVAFVFGIAGYRQGAVWVGPVALGLLAAGIAAALLRARFKRSWRWVHRVNYLVFVAVLVHGLLLGTDLRSGPLLRVVLGVYAAMAAAGLVRRAVRRPAS